MDIATILADATAVVNLGKIAVELGQSAETFLLQLYQLLVEGKPLTDEQRAANTAQEASLRDMLNADSIPADKA